MKVFFADDSLHVRELLQAMLSQIPGVEIVGQAKDAIPATDLIRTLKPDVVILDLALIHGSGLGVLGTIKKERPSPLVVVFSGYDDASHRNTCLNLGADYFLSKADGFDQVAELCKKLAPQFQPPRSASKDKP